MYDNNIINKDRLCRFTIENAYGVYNMVLNPNRPAEIKSDRLV